MVLDEWGAVLRTLADDPDEYEQQANVVMFTRQGREILLTLREVPTIGLGVEVDPPSADQAASLVPIATYIQRDILGLPFLAGQITRSLEKAQQTRPGRFVEGPAEFVHATKTERWDSSHRELRRLLLESDTGTTRLIQLMAPAGHGKTMLLEHAALEIAKAYQPDPFPTPILLTVDLLGRYVGTIDDAIAGSLNNTYIFPGLTQKDVILAIGRRWLILALDGFDELVARVGVRDAFGRITDLLDQLRNSGTIILSARQSFFELFQISAAVRTYLDPRSGSYSTSVINLLPWQEAQARNFFEALGSASPEVELAALLRTFEGDREIVFHPFFLTRLAKLWMEGERFSGASQQADRLARTRFVIERFIQRESGEKWVDRDQRPYLSPEEHTEVLACIAEEMWRSGAFRLDAEELRVAAEIGLNELGLDAQSSGDILSRIPTHAALTLRDRGYSFIHDQFLHFFLGYRLAKLILTQDHYSVREILMAREFGPSVAQWIAWNCRSGACPILPAMDFLNSLTSSSDDITLSGNAARLCCELLNRADLGEPVTARHQTFVGDILLGGSYSRVVFDRCRFWHVDLCGTSFVDCRFADCKFGDIRVDSQTRFTGSQFARTSVESIETTEHWSCFAPSEITRELKRHGLTIEASVVDVQEKPPVAAVKLTTIRCVERFVRASEKTCDVAVEDVEERHGHEARVVAKLAQESGVAREVSKHVSGPKKTFIRFTVDRHKLLRGQAETTKVAEIDKFWKELARKYPA